MELIATAQQLLEQVRQSSEVTFVHVRGHTGEEGNERADRLMQWGKTAGPYSRLALSGAGEGSGLSGRVEGHLRKTERVGEDLLEELFLGEGDADEFVRLAGAEVDVATGDPPRISRQFISHLTNSCIVRVLLYIGPKRVLIYANLYERCCCY